MSIAFMKNYVGKRILSLIIESNELDPLSDVYRRHRAIINELDVINTMLYSITKEDKVP